MRSNNKSINSLARRQQFATDLHPAVWGTSIYILVAVGRVPELFPVLSVLQLGNVALLLGLIGIGIGGPKNVRIGSYSLSRWMILFVLLAIISVAFSIWGSRSLLILRTQFASAIATFFLVSISAYNARTISAYLTIIVISFLMLSVEALQFDWGGRIELARNYDANDLGMVMVTGVGFCFGLAKAYRDYRRRILYLVSVICILATFLTQSRGGLVGLVLVGAYYVTVVDRAAGTRGFRFPSISKTLVLGTLSVVLLSFAPGAGKDRLMSLFSLEDDYNVTSEEGRIEIWKRGLSSMVNRPYGSGIGVSRAAEGLEGGRHKAIHNSLLEVGVELGFLGLALYLSCYISSWRRLGYVIASARKAIKDDEANMSAHQAFHWAIGFRGGIIGFFATSFFLSRAYSAVFFALLGLSLGLSWMIDSEQRMRGTID